MQLVVKNKFWSLGGASTVKDIQDHPVANVKGKVFSVTKKKFIKDLQGNTQYIVRNKFWHFFMKSAYIYDKDKNLICQIKRKFHINSKFRILKSGDKNWEIDGNFWGWNWKLLENGVVIAAVSRRIDWTDAFVLDTGAQDPLLMVALVIALDNIVDRERNQTR